MGKSEGGDADGRDGTAKLAEAESAYLRPRAFSFIIFSSITNIYLQSLRAAAFKTYT